MAMQAMMPKKVIQNKTKLYQMKKAKKVMMVGLETAAAVTKNKLQAAPSISKQLYIAQNNSKQSDWI